MQYRYDGWGNVDTEWQEHIRTVDANFSYGSVYVAYEYDDGSYDSDAFYDATEGVSAAKYVRLVNVTYPKVDQYTAGRMVEYHYDGDSVNGTVDDIMSRVDKIVNNAAEADYKYLGANTVVTEDFSDVDVKIDYSANNFAAWDRFGRVRDQIWSDYGSTPSTLDRFTYTYNRAGNVTAKNNVLNSPLNEIYAYDNLDRLTSSDRAGGSTQDQTWTLDGSGNMAGVTTGSTTQTRTVNKANEIQTASGWIAPQYDAAGNMKSGPQPGNETARVFYQYDAWNRLTGVYQDDGDGVFEPGTDDALVAQFVYDGQNRRIRKITDSASGLGDNYYYNQNWQMVEDREGSDWYGTTAVNSYIWSLRYTDSPMVCLRDGDVDGELTSAYPSDWKRYYLTDANHNVTTTIRVGKYVDNEPDYVMDVSRNVYTTYGSVTRFDENWLNTSVEQDFDSPLYAGYFFDHETGLYQVRNRYYDAGLSVWLSRDPIESTPNLYAYCGNKPINSTDPTGEAGPGLHHGYPLYLGGSVNQPVWDFKTVANAAERHSAAQNYFIQRGFGPGDAGAPPGQNSARRSRRQ